MTFVLLHAAVSVPHLNISRNNVFLLLLLKIKLPWISEISSRVQALVPLLNKNIKTDIIFFLFLGNLNQRACFVSTTFSITLLLFCHFSSPS